ncbi:ABC transporter substrate-binding protein [Paenibacillus sp.]|uniref:ABC transporter substrate-binding protein n=1 Tax=Paenibacillus sp. TaxID=58172 RepID=UPI002D4382B4|nr:extracellular solute-binding protein [Paenibacillus sp.]HZG87263.1 extracellular solute-binding protein [Paenibacillus sp.]
MMKRGALLLFSVMLAFVTAACSSGGGGGSGGSDGKTADSGSAGGSSGEAVELNVWLFTGTGMEPFMEAYAKEHNIKLNIQQQEYADHHNGLVTALAAGSGAPDIALVEIGYIDQFKADESKFYNLADFGANDIMGDYLEWKKVQASSQDGSFIFGIPTDIGPMAAMYRTDLFEQAGLPTNRDEVSKLFSSWEAFVDVGRTIKEKTGKPMVDAANSVFDVVIGQATEHYFDEKGELIVETNPAVRRAYDLATGMAQEGLTAKITQWSPEWGAGMNNGDFAVQMAPAWMIGFMKANAPDSAGKWDIAAMPEGSGNWGGSFLTIPKESKNAQVAYDMIKTILSPAGQLELFKSNGNFPSTPSVFDDPAIQEFKDDFFSGAPVGSIYAEAAKKVTPVYYGPKYIIVDTPLTNAITEVERNGTDREAAWKTAMDQIKRDLRQ